MSLSNVITIDGVASSGKTSTAAKIAHKLNYSIFDSGSLYRSFAFFLIEQNINIEKPRQVFLALQEFEPIILDDGRILFQDRDVTRYLYQSDVDKLTPYIGGGFFIRKKIREIQRGFCIERQGKVVVTGRDVGTEVFPESENKFFLQASAEVRALRRYLQILETQPDSDLELILAGLVMRDGEDSNRKVSPMMVPDDALLIDSTELDSNQVVKIIIDEINRKKISIEGSQKRGKEF